MQNTLEKKSKFFAQYWGQRVFKWLPEHSEGVVISFVGRQIENYSGCGFLILKPLSSITDEDAIEVAKIVENSIRSADTGDLVTLFYTEVKKDPYVLAFASYETVDYLRSKGYALPYMGLSVEKQIEYGWIKLLG